MTRKVLITILQSTLNIKKKDLKSFQENLRNAWKQEDEFEVGFNTGLILELETEIDFLEKILMEVL